MPVVQRAFLVLLTTICLRQVTATLSRVSGEETVNVLGPPKCCPHGQALDLDSLSCFEAAASDDNDTATVDLDLDASYGPFSPATSCDSASETPAYLMQGEFVVGNVEGKSGVVLTDLTENQVRVSATHF